MSFEFDTPSGVAKDHALSMKIRQEAIADAVIAKFASPEPNFGRGRGKSITITRVMALPPATRVQESQDLPKGRPVVDTISLDVSEWGYAVELTELEEHLSHYNPRDKVQRELRRQLTITMDIMVADAFKTTPIKVVSNGGNLSFSTNGTPAAQCDANLTVPDVLEIRDYLYGTLKCPRYRNGNYVGILSTKAARGIRPRRGSFQTR